MIVVTWSSVEIMRNITLADDKLSVVQTMEMGSFFETTSYIVGKEGNVTYQYFSTSYFFSFSKELWQPFNKKIYSCNLEQYLFEMSKFVFMITLMSNLDNDITFLEKERSMFVCIC